MALPARTSLRELKTRHPDIFTPKLQRYHARMARAYDNAQKHDGTGRNVLVLLHNTLSKHPQHARQILDLTDRELEQEPDVWPTLPFVGRMLSAHPQHARQLLAIAKITLSKKQASWNALTPLCEMLAKHPRHARQLLAVTKKMLAREKDVWSTLITLRETLARHSQQAPQILRLTGKALGTSQDTRSILFTLREVLSEHNARKVFRTAHAALNANLDVPVNLNHLDYAPARAPQTGTPRQR